MPIFSRFRTWTLIGLISAGITAVPLHAQPLETLPPPGGELSASVTAGMRGALKDFLQKALSQPKLLALKTPERRAVATLVLSASMLVDSARCADPGAGDAAAWNVVASLGELNESAGPALTDLPFTRKAQLIDMAMDIEAHRQPQQDLAFVLCSGKLLPDAQSKPLPQRRSDAKQMLEAVMSPPDEAEKGKPPQPSRP